MSNNARSKMVEGHRHFQNMEHHEMEDEDMANKR